MRSKIKFHYTFLIFVSLGLICGIFKKLIVIYIIILLHEFGHLLFIKMFRRKVNKITILPLGGIIDYHNNENMPLYQDFLINGGGLIVNGILFIFFKKGLFYEYNLMVFVFNILPIFPLDGGRILEVILSRFFRYKLVLIFVFIISVLTIILVFIYNVITLKALSTYLVFFFLLMENINSFKERRIKYQMFLLKKYMYPNKDLRGKKQKIKGNITDFFHRGVNNIFLLKNKTIDEKVILGKYFNR